MRSIAVTDIKAGGGELLRIFFLIVLSVAVAANPAVGQVQLPTVNLGGTNFEDGFGAPGWLLEEFPAGYIANGSKDSKGKTVPGSNQVTTYTTTSHVVFASRNRFLGGWIAGEALLLAECDRRRFAHPRPFQDPP